MNEFVTNLHALQIRGLGGTRTNLFIKAPAPAFQLVLGIGISLL